jgi:hypothetical protein
MTTIIISVLATVFVAWLFGGMPGLPHKTKKHHIVSDDPCAGCDVDKEGVYEITDRYPERIAKIIFAELDTLGPDPRAPLHPKCPIPLEKRVCRHSLERVREVAAAVAAKNS